MGIANVNLKLIADQREWGPGDLVRLMGRTPSFWSDRLNDRNNIGAKLARDIEVAFGLPRYWMDEDHSSEKVAQHPQPAAPPEPSNVESGLDLKAFRAVPHVGEVKGGQDGYFEELQYPTGHGDGVIDYPTTDRNAYALRVRGDSMHPRYRAGEYIVVEPSIEPQPGEDVVVICRDGRKLLKTLAWTRGGSVSLLSINNGHAPVTLDLADIERMHTVAGVVPARALRKLAGSESPSSSGSPQTSGTGPWSW